MRARFRLFPVFSALVLAAAVFIGNGSLRPAVALPALPVETITIDTKAGPHAFTVEIAADDESRENAA